MLEMYVYQWLACIWAIGMYMGDRYVYCRLVGGGARSPEKCLRSIDLQKEFIKKMTLDLFGFLTYQAGWGLACITKAGMYVCMYVYD